MNSQGRGSSAGTAESFLQAIVIVSAAIPSGSLLPRLAA